ncbi:MAG: class I SAM-dependent methyltransferase [Acidimicrobiales bacterium]
MTTQELIEIDGHTFDLRPIEGRRGIEGAFTLKKPRWTLDRYLGLAEEFQGANVVELGLWDGGSTAFLASAFQPRSLVGFELHERPLTTLERFLDGHPLRDSVHVHLGVDQADAPALRRSIDAEVDGPLDVVVDDASHLLGPTAASFDCLFPLLRPHGVYVIEDWSWDHQLAFGIRQSLASGELGADELLETNKGVIPASPLSRLIIDIMLATANPDGIVEEIRVERGFAVVRRGATELDPDGFSLRDLIGEIGREVSPRPD